MFLASSFGGFQLDCEMCLFDYCGSILFSDLGNSKTLLNFLYSEVDTGYICSDDWMGDLRVYFDLNLIS